MLTLEKLRQEMEPFHNHICVLYDMDLVRLVGVAEDEYDLYYIVRETSTKGEYWASAVGHIISLKGIYPSERYQYMDKLFELNRAGKTDKFLVEKQPHIGLDTGWHGT